ncbi:MAG: hypothetical protein IJD58_00085 [Lachnospiraceae bacterium]|nr:hypothetical protein [Lachnospiraceae bacterium]
MWCFSYTNTTAVYDAATCDAISYDVATKKKKPWIILGITITLLVAVITTVIILLFACNGDKSSSPKKLTKNIFKALANEDEDKLESCIYPTMLREYNSSYSDDYDEFCEEYIDEFYYTVENRLDLDDIDSCRVTSVRITETKEVSP